MWKGGSCLYLWWCEETLCASCCCGLPEASSPERWLLLIAFLVSKLSRNYYMGFFGISRKILRNRTLCLSCLVFGDKSTQSWHTFWVGRRWGRAGGDTDPAWKDRRVPGPLFSAREFIEAQFNYKTGHGISLKINFYCKNKKNSHELQSLIWSRKWVCLFLYFLWREMLWNPKGLI